VRNPSGMGLGRRPPRTAAAARGGRRVPRQGEVFPLLGDLLAEGDIDTGVNESFIPLAGRKDSSPAA
jgi:hypothetical protein